MIVAVAALGALAAYIDGGGAQITLPEIILEFHTATLVEVEKADPSRGALRFKIVKPLKGKLGAKEIKVQISWEGAVPPQIKDLKPGQTAVLGVAVDNVTDLFAIPMMLQFDPNGGMSPDFLPLLIPSVIALTLSQLKALLVRPGAGWAST